MCRDYIRRCIMAHNGVSYNGGGPIPFDDRMPNRLYICIRTPSNEGPMNDEGEIQ